MAKITELIGRTLTSVNVNRTMNTIIFVCRDGDVYEMYHDQECCEDVTIEDICGDSSDLVGSPILQAEEVTKNGWDESREPDGCSHTWTFYKFATIKGAVTMRWYGESSGNYSEKVDFRKLNNDEEIEE